MRDLGWGGHDLLWPAATSMADGLLFVDVRLDPRSYPRSNEAFEQADSFQGVTEEALHSPGKGVA